MKKWMVLLWLFSCATICGQNRNKIDSLKNSIKNKTSTKKLVEGYNLLSNEYFEFKNDSSLFFANKAINLSVKLNDRNTYSKMVCSLAKKLIKLGDFKNALNRLQVLVIDIKEHEENESEVINLIATCYYNLGKYNKAIEFYKKSIDLYSGANKEIHIIRANINIALCNAEIGNNNKAKNIYLESIDKLLELNNLNVLSMAYTNLGLLYFSESNFQNAIEYHTKAFEIDSLNEDKYGMALDLNNMAIVYNNIGETQRSIDCFLRALKINEKLGYKEEVAANYNNIGYLYKHLGDKETAREYYNKALKINLLINQRKALGLNYSGIASTFGNNLDSTYFYLNKAQKIFESTSNNHFLAATYDDIGVIRLKQNKYTEAEMFFSKSLEIYDTIPNLKYKSQALSNLALSLVYQNKTNPSYLDKSFFSKYGNTIDDFLATSKKYSIKSGDFESILNFYNTSINIYKGLKKYEKVAILNDSLTTIKDTIFSIDKYKAVKDIEAKYETQKRENKILKLTNDNLEKESSLVQLRHTVLGVIAILVLSLSLIYFIWAKRKQKHRLDLLQNTIQTSENEKIRIGKKLHDDVAGNIMKLIYDSESKQVQLSHDLLQIYEQIRNVSHELDNKPIQDEPFFDRMLDIIPESTTFHKFDFNISPHDIKVNEPHGTHIFRILQELITNNLKYANANQTKISIIYNEDVVKIDYEDNGKGTLDFKKGNGYKNIENRLTLLKGSIDISHNSGFSVTLLIPYTI